MMSGGHRSTGARRRIRPAASKASRDPPARHHAEEGAMTAVHRVTTVAIVSAMVWLVWAACVAGAWAAPAAVVRADAASAHVGPRLAFARNGDVWTIVADGGGLKRLTSSSSYESAPAWSPGRGTLAYTSAPRDSGSKHARLWVMRSDGTNQRRLTYVGPSLTSGSSALAYSPGGSLIAGGAKLAAQNKWAVTVLDLKARTSRIVYRYDSAGGVESLTWSPDGHQLVATIEYGGTYGMVRIDVVRDRLIKMRGSGNVESASWRPDGKYLLCSKWFPTVSGGPFRTILMKPDGTGVKTLGENQRFPVYSPDGSRYAFIEYVNDGSVLKLAAADGSGITTILSAEDIWNVAWR
jgi:Tol biopolymer transport system component